MALQPPDSLASLESAAYTQTSAQAAKPLTDRFTKTDNVTAIDGYQLTQKCLTIASSLSSFATTIRTIGEQLRRLVPTNGQALLGLASQLEGVQRGHATPRENLREARRHLPVIKVAYEIPAAIESLQEQCLEFVLQEKGMQQRIDALKDNNFQTTYSLLQSTTASCEQILKAKGQPIAKFRQLEQLWPNILKCITDTQRTIKPLLNNDPHIDAHKKRQDRELYRSIVTEQIETLLRFKQAVLETRRQVTKDLPDAEKPAADQQFTVLSQSTEKAVNDEITKTRAILESADVKKKPLPPVSQEEISAVDRTNVRQNATIEDREYTYYKFWNTLWRGASATYRSYQISYNFGTRYQNEVALDLVALDKVVRARLIAIAEGITQPLTGKQSLQSECDLYQRIFNEISQNFMSLREEYSRQVFDGMTPYVLNYAHNLRDSLKDVRRLLKLLYKFSSANSVATANAASLIKQHLTDKFANHPAKSAYLKAETLLNAAQSVCSAVDLQKGHVRDQSLLHKFINQTQIILHRIVQEIFPAAIDLTNDDALVHDAIFGYQSLDDLRYEGEDTPEGYLPLRVRTYIIKRILDLTFMKDPIDVDFQAFMFVLKNNPAYQASFALTLQNAPTLQQAIALLDQKVQTKGREAMTLSEPQPSEVRRTPKSQIETVSDILHNLYLASRQDSRNPQAYAIAVQGLIEFRRDTRAELARATVIRNAGEYIAGQLELIAKSQMYVPLYFRTGPQIGSRWVDKTLRDWIDEVSNRPVNFKTALRLGMEDFRLKSSSEYLQGLLLRILGCCLYGASPIERWQAQTLLNCIMENPSFSDLVVQLHPDVEALLHENTKNKLIVRDKNISDERQSYGQVTVGTREKDLLIDHVIKPAIDENQFPFKSLSTSHAIVRLVQIEATFQAQAPRPLTAYLVKKFGESVFTEWMRSYKLLTGEANL